MIAIDSESREKKFKKAIYSGFTFGFLTGLGFGLGLVGICAILALVADYL